MKTESISGPDRLSRRACLDRALGLQGQWTDLSIGSAQFGIALPVFIESHILEKHREIEVGLGLNVAGVILSVLSCRLAVEPEGDAINITVCLFERQDARALEVTLYVQRTVFANRPCLLISKTC